MQDLVRIPLLILIKNIIDGVHTNNLTIVSMRALEQGDGLQIEDITSKLLCFGADGVVTFQGTKIGVTTQIISKHAPYCIEMHHMAHGANLAFKRLSFLDVVARVEELLQSICTYFAHSPKRFLHGAYRPKRLEDAQEYQNPVDFTS